MRERQEAATREAPVAGGVIGRASHVRGLVVATVAALVMTLVGAFGTAAAPLLQRLGYWLIIMETGAMLGIGASTGVRSWGRLAHRRWLEAMLVSVLIAAPLTLVVLGVTSLMFGLSPPGVGAMLGMFLGVLAVTGVITAINYATNPPSGVTPPIPNMIVDGGPAQQAIDPVALDANTLAQSAPQPRLLDRLPAHARSARIIALSSEDHYLRVHTDQGSHLILLRMSDAMAELDGMIGARTHRSWWVAREAVTRATRGEGRGELSLSNGMIAPISRSSLVQLQAEGWFDTAVR